MACRISPFLLFSLALSGLVVVTVQQSIEEIFPCRGIGELGYLNWRPERLFHHDNMLYFVFGKQVIFTKKIVRDKSLSSDQVSVIVYPFYRQSVDEKTPEQLGFFKGFSLQGHFYQNFSKSLQSLEMYSISDQLLTDTAIELGFNKVKGERRTAKLLTHIKLDKVLTSGNLYNFMKGKRISQYSYLDIFCDWDPAVTQYCFVVELPRQSNQGNVIEFSFTAMSEKAKQSIANMDRPTASNPKDRMVFAVYFNSLEVKNEHYKQEYKYEATFVAATPETADNKDLVKFHVTHIDKGFNDLHHRSFDPFSFSVAEFFGCNTMPFNYTTDLRGVFIDLKNQVIVQQTLSLSLKICFKVRVKSNQVLLARQPISSLDAFASDLLRIWFREDCTLRITSLHQNTTW